MGNDIRLYEPITVLRDCDAILIPAGTPITVPMDSSVHVTQALGGSVTININGNLARIAGRDLDALGFEPERPPVLGADASRDEVERIVWDQLRTCYDPEIPINIVELGLVYECTVIEAAAGDGYRVQVSMTLTAPGCGMGSILVEDIKGKMRQIPHVTDVEVELIFDPPWDPSMMSEAARLQTGML
ncbi:MAG: putative Fe-S cluster assembly protein SufT [Gammaproteobacteria bacterium]